jgi:two-component system nitrogen regulation sensor histidine kinase GlnL
MTDKRVVKLNKTSAASADIDAELILGALPSAVLVVDGSAVIRYVNTAAEDLFKSSARSLRGQRLDTQIPADSPLFALIRQARNGGYSVSEYHLTLASPRIGHHSVNVQAAPLSEAPDCIVLAVQERSLAVKIDRQLTHRGAARSVSAMAAMLAHEVKNPLAGIRGAAQLLEGSVQPEDRALTALIRDETDRVCGLVDRMEVFTASGPLHREPVNIHEVLNRVRRLAETSFGGHLHFSEHYDPSLPDVFGNRDQLVQVFLNLIKNAAEAAPVEGSEVLITTAYWHGIRFAVAGKTTRVHLPLMVSVQDNGDGIPEDLKPHLFDPFVTSKPKGSGLGLALVAKIIGDHGGVIEFESVPKRTVFRVMLPMVTSVEEKS